MEARLIILIGTTPQTIAMWMQQQRGYATLSYDRLGTGYSQHPDPIQVVQTAVQVELLHVLVSFLKIGKIGGHCFSDVIRIAHSLGSAYMQAVSARYPDGFSALVLTGYSAFLPGSSIGITSMAQQIANTLPPEQFSGLASGHITQCPLLQCLQFEFYYEPYYDTEILERQVESRQTTALGETLTVMDAFPLALEFKKPVFIFNGEKDYFYCQGSCNGTHDITGGALALFLPNAAVTSMAENLPNTGHSINFHFSAGVGFRKLLDFISSTGV